MMILYNVTLKVDPQIHEEWKQWMCEVHIPDVMSTGLFKEYKMCKLLGLDEADGITYAVQYFSASMEDFEEYQSKHAKRLQTEHMNRYKDRYVAFRTMMEVVSS
ncbi:MAG: DUF4286 family protein [Saprospiraceae bacterium]|nr:DUF4286 family protein [Saprospiraceae bacterium]